VGVDLAWMANNTATIAYYNGESKNGPASLTTNSKSSTVVVSNDYALSKRTTLYAQAVFVDAGGANAVRNEVSAGVTQRDEKSTIVGIGVKHDF
jgi:predicted porin